jgi:hypothetical protein
MIKLGQWILKHTSYSRLICRYVQLLKYSFPQIENSPRWYSSGLTYLNHILSRDHISFLGISPPLVPGAAVAGKAGQLFDIQGKGGIFRLDHFHRPFVGTC